VGGLDEAVNTSILGLVLTGLVHGFTWHEFDNLRGPHRLGANRVFLVIPDIQVNDGVIPILDVTLNVHFVPDVVTNNRSLVLITIVLESGGDAHVALGLVHTSGFTRLPELALVNFLAVLVQEGFDPEEATFLVGHVLGGGVYTGPVDLDAFEGRYEFGIVLAFRSDALARFVHVVRSLVQLEREGGVFWNLTRHIRLVDEGIPDRNFWGCASNHGNRKLHLRVTRDEHAL